MSFYGHNKLGEAGLVKMIQNGPPDRAAAAWDQLLTYWAYKRQALKERYENNFQHRDTSEQ